MIVLDTNVLISALIKDSITRRIIVESGFDFVYPELSMAEILKYKEYILEKSGYSKKEFELIMNKLLEYINLIPWDLIKQNMDEARKIMEKIDIKDSIFLATALMLDKATIWSDDHDFSRQNKVKIVKTSDMVKMFEK